MIYVTLPIFLFVVVTEDCSFVKSPPPLKVNCELSICLTVKRIYVLMYCAESRIITNKKCVSR